MANFVHLTTAHRTRTNELRALLFRAESLNRRGDLRAARTILGAFYRDAESLVEQMNAPLEFLFVGANMGLLSGRGSFVRGRLPAAALGAALGWLVGQVSILERERTLRELLEQASDLQGSLMPKMNQET